MPYYIKNLSCSRNSSREKKKKKKNDGVFVKRCVSSLKFKRCRSGQTAPYSSRNTHLIHLANEIQPTLSIEGTFSGPRSVIFILFYLKKIIFGPHCQILIYLDI